MSHPINEPLPHQWFFYCRPDRQWRFHDQLLAVCSRCPHYRHLAGLTRLDVEPFCCNAHAAEA